MFGLGASQFGFNMNIMPLTVINKQWADHTLFLNRDGDDITLLIVYVDDMIVTGSNPKEVEKHQSHLAKEYEMKDLGTLKYF